MAVINPKPEPILESVSIFREEILREESVPIVAKNKVGFEGGEALRPLVLRLTLADG